MLIVNDQSINPMPVITGAAEYPDDILDRLKKSTAKAIIINAIDIAKEIGNIRVANSVLLGVLAKYTDIDYKNWGKSFKPYCTTPNG